MTESNDTLADVAVRKRRSLSIVWLIPIVAAGIAGWLVYTTLAEKGPVLTLVFKTGEGLEADRTDLLHPYRWDINWRTLPMRCSAIAAHR